MDTRLATLAWRLLTFVAIATEAFDMWWKKQKSPASVRERLALFNNGLEVGLCDNSVLTQLFAELEAAPSQLLPNDMPVLGHTAFLLWKSGKGDFSKRLLFTCLAWYLKNSKDPDEISTITGNIQHILTKEGIEASVEQIQGAAERGAFGHAASWRFDAAAIESAKPVAEISGNDVSMQRIRLSGRVTSLVPDNMPLTTFHGWLKRLDPAVLNAAGKLALEHIFPMFANLTPEQYLARAELLARCYISLSDEQTAEVATLREVLKQGVPIKLRRHRRFSGGDGLLPRNCYSSLCKNAAGDDGGSLSRELLAYIDPRVPGTVFATDSTDAGLHEYLGGGLTILPGFCATYILVFAPTDRDDRAAFNEIYRDLMNLIDGFDQSVFAFALETRVDECTIDNVLDLRLPRTQQWFFEHFVNGDGVFLTKNGGTAREFYDLLPTLMHPALGGTDVTHAIGSWMRVNGANGLIFPSSRSDASVQIRNGELVDWHGWNFVDYRTAKDIPATELTSSQGGWPDFLQSGAQVAVVPGGEMMNSWKVMGLQTSYDQMRAALARDQGDDQHAESATIGSEGGPVSPPADIGPTS